MTLSDLDLKPF